jgi:hypothetical protein
MRSKINTVVILLFCIFAFSFVVFSQEAQIRELPEGGTVYTVTGADVVAIQATVDTFRSSLGTNNGVGNSFKTGRREINWDDVPDSFSQPNSIPSDFFNANSQRGVVLDNLKSTNTTLTSNKFSVSARNAAKVGVRFGNINAQYPTIFKTFSSEKLFIANQSNLLQVKFFIPGTSTRAEVFGFGVIFTDVNTAATTSVKFQFTDGASIDVDAVPFLGGLSFVGVVSSVGVDSITIKCGTLPAALADNGTSPQDVVAMDDFIYGEPRVTRYHSSDFDGDGVTDTAVFRPTNGNWFILNSGSNTVTFDTFGQNGDRPIEGDFDGDKLSDVAIFRPSVGEWYFKRSKDNSVFGATFGVSTDKPVPGDYDKDGKTDIAFFRPGSGNNWFVLRSRTNFSTFYAYPFGIAGDIPLPTAAQ